MDEAAAIRELREVENDLDKLERCLGIEPDAPQQEATRNKLHGRRAHLIRVIHAGEIHRLEVTGILPPGCDDPNCEPCYSHNIGGFQRLENSRKGIRWNAATQTWQRRTWREATPAEIAAYEADDDPDDAPPPARYQTWKSCWTGTRYGCDDDPLQIRWNRLAGRYEAEQWQ